ncbi:MAG: transporter substrate-binding domain-containing protein [Chloroflexota bacterium]
MAPSIAPSLAPSIAPSVAPSIAPSIAPSLAPSIAPSVAPSNDLLARIKEKGVIRVSIEPQYPPYSFQKPDETFDGFNVDVANEIAKRLGVTAAFEIPSFDLVVAGSWNDQWDMSVGAVTITDPRKEVLDFTQPYAYSPAQMAVTNASGITTLDGLAGQTVCVGAATTYQQWIEGTLSLVDAPPPAVPPAGATTFPLPTDTDCILPVQSGTANFQGWLTSADTLEPALASGIPMTAVGDPVFYESLGIAFDKTVADNEALVAAVDAIVGEMHQDGTLLTLSEKWFNGKDRVTAH